ncbi:MAG: TrbC/VirB2 family protein [Candidatus Staskawiczbacteria bacterium]|nr:TrbC/VirB2 family protein [Candidatus Staskawiczbacteria bacterium]
MKKIYILSLVFVSLFCLASFACLPSDMALAQGTSIPNPLHGGGVDNFGQLLEKIATGVGTLIASLGVIMIIVAGILYLLSAGNPERVGTAKKALFYAILGIVIGLAANAIVAIVKEVIGVP